MNDELIDMPIPTNDLGDYNEHQIIKDNFLIKINNLIDKYGNSTSYYKLNDEINNLSSDFCKYDKNMMYLGDNSNKIIDYTMKYITGKISILTNDNSKYFKWIEV